MATREINEIIWAVFQDSRDFFSQLGGTPTSLLDMLYADLSRSRIVPAVNVPHAKLSEGALKRREGSTAVAVSVRLSSWAELRLAGGEIQTGVESIARRGGPQAWRADPVSVVPSWSCQSSSCE